MMRRSNAFAPYRKASFASTMLTTAFILALEMAPLHWWSNEINYFDWASRLLNPAEFGPNHSVFDHSLVRVFSFAVIGSLVDLFGQDGALVVSRIAMVVVYAGSFSILVHSLRLGSAESIVALILFILIGQDYFGGEFLFSSVEPKIFAYAAVLPSIALAWRANYLPAVMLAALATYFHFQVGGFWAAAVVLLIGLKGENFLRAGKLLALYVLLILPVLMILVHEQFVAPAPDVSDLDLNFGQIYSMSQSSHHIAPFSDIKRLVKWVPGIVAMLATTCFLAILVRLSVSDRRLSAQWLLTLHAYLILSLVVAFFDRETQALGPFFLFRPNSLILLLTLLFGLVWIRQSSPTAIDRRMAVVAMFMAVIFAVPRVESIGQAIFVNPQLPLARSLAPEDRELVDWLRGTSRQAVVVIEPTWQTDWDMPWVALERLIDRPTLVNFKAVPIAKPALARWYRLVRWREAVFRGDCGRVLEQPVNYLVTVNAATLKLISNCGSVVWTNGAYSVVQVNRP